MKSCDRSLKRTWHNFELQKNQNYDLVVTTNTILPSPSLSSTITTTAKMTIEKHDNVLLHWHRWFSLRWIHFRYWNLNLLTLSDSTMTRTEMMMTCNLKSCTWLRDGSLKSNILEALHQRTKNLRDLELNGFTELHLSATEATLRSLTLLICKVRSQLVITVWSYALFQASCIFTDEILEAIAPSLVIALEGVYYKFVSWTRQFMLH